MKSSKIRISDPPWQSSRSQLAEPVAVVSEVDETAFLPHSASWALEIPHLASRSFMRSFDVRHPWDLRYLHELGYVVQAWENAIGHVSRVMLCAIRSASFEYRDGIWRMQQQGPMMKHKEIPQSSQSHSRANIRTYAR